jgi:hypothetical protein
MPDDGLPIAYEVLQPGVPIYASDGTCVGTVQEVIAAPELDIFHGIEMQMDSRPCFIAAEHVQSLHEHRVDLRIDAAAVAQLPASG